MTFGPDLYAVAMESVESSPITAISVGLSWPPEYRDAGRATMFLIVCSSFPAGMRSARVGATGSR